MSASGDAASAGPLELDFDVGASPSWKAYVQLFEGVSNAAEVLAIVRRGELDVCAIDAAAVPSLDVLHLAVFKALYGREHWKGPKASTMHAEVLWCLCPHGRKIVEGFRRFGVTGSSTSILFVHLEPADPGAAAAAVRAVVRGSEAAASRAAMDGALRAAAATPAGTDRIRRAFEVEDGELTVGSLQDAALCAIGAREVM